MNLYLDTSALIKRYIAEAGSPDARGWIRSAEAVATALITRAETAAAFNRLLRMKALTPGEYSQALEGFRRDWADYQRIPITDSLVAHADSLACAATIPFIWPVPCYGKTYWDC